MALQVKILIIDDDPDICEYMTTMLESAGYEVSAEDSISMVPVFATPELQIRSFLYSEIFDPNAPMVATRHDRAVTDGRYKLIRRIGTMDQFYDLQVDPFETILDLADEFVEVGGVDLLSEEVETHLNAGKLVARLSLQWDERLSLVLAEDLCLRRLKFADELMKENEDIPEADNAARLDADFALMSDAITTLQDKVLNLFGGEATE